MKKFMYINPDGKFLFKSGSQNQIRVYRKLPFCHEKYISIAKLEYISDTQSFDMIEANLIGLFFSKRIGVEISIFFNMNYNSSIEEY